MFILALSTVLLAADPIPLVGRPADFSGAVGGPFEITTIASPDSVEIGQPIKFIVRITGSGDLSQMRRPDLEHHPDFEGRFTIENGSERTLTNPNDREFEYTLRARRTELAVVPSLKLVYFNPNVQPAERAFQTTYSNELRIRISRRERATSIVSDDFRQRVERLRSELGVHGFFVDAIMNENYGSAISCFRGLLQIEPWNAAASEALALARSRVVYPSDGKLAAELQPEQRWYPDWLFRPWAFLLGLVAWGITCYAGKQWLKFHRHRWRTVTLIFLIPGLIPLVDALIFMGRAHRNDVFPSVAVHRDATLRSGNGHDYPVILRLPKGTEARQIGIRIGPSTRPEKWCQIELASGVTGCLSSEDAWWMDVAIPKN